MKLKIQESGGCFRIFPDDPAHPLAPALKFEPGEWVLVRGKLCRTSETGALLCPFFACSDKKVRARIKVVSEEGITEIETEIPDPEAEERARATDLVKKQNRSRDIINALMGDDKDVLVFTRDRAISPVPDEFFTIWLHRRQVILRRKPSVRIPQRYMGMLIGKGGRNIKQIRLESGINFQLIPARAGSGRKEEKRC